MRKMICGTGIMAMLLMGAAMALAAPETAPAVKEGTLVGTVTEKGETWIRVKGDDGTSLRFIPNWVGGGPDKDMVKQIAAVKVGDKVSVKWVFNEHYRVIELTVQN